MAYLLWFDNDKNKTTAQKISEGAEFYRRRYHGNPNHVRANPRDLPALVDGLEIEESNSTLPNHFYIGEK